MGEEKMVNGDRVDDFHTVEKQLIQRISQLEIGFNEEDFIISMSLVGNGASGDKICGSIPIQHLKELVKALFLCGQTYEEQFGKNIGFSVKGEE